MESNESYETSKRPKFDGICITKQTMDKLLRQPGGDEMIALYLFYCYTGLWQGTNQPHATIRFVMKGLRWGRDKVREVRKKLAALGLIEDVRRRDERGRIRWFVRVRYFHPTGFQEGGATGATSTLLISPPAEKSRRVDSKPPNALRAVKGNALRADKENAFRAGTRSSLRSERTRAASADAPAPAPVPSLPVGIKKLLTEEEAIERIAAVAGPKMAEAAKAGHILKTRYELLKYANMSEAHMLKTRGLIGSGWSVRKAQLYKQVGP